MMIKKTLPLIILFVLSTLCFSATVITNITEPIGTLQANPTIVQSGTKPTLTWNIQYPINISHSVDKQVPGSLKPKKKLLMECRVIGTGVTHRSPYSGLIVYDICNIHIKVGNADWSQIFYDSNPNVDPSKVIYSRLVDLDEVIHFKGTYFILEDPRSRTWFDSSTQSPNIRVLFNGDTPPEKLPAHGSPSLKQFIAPYLDANGKVAIGPMDAIYFFELTHTPAQSGLKGYDMQDYIMLVTFTPR